ncbi:MAG TPA: DUF2771 family protein [Jatrophihabitans sp.]|jgi:hypothetical protein
MAKTAKTRVAAGLGIVAGTVALAACSKPAPNVTAQAGSTSVVVKASTYCFDPDKCTRHVPDFPSITVAPDDKVLVDVPRKVVGHGWAINAVDLDGKTSLGNSGAITDSHSYKVTAGINNGSPFIVQVVQLDGNKPDGSMWSFLVKIDPTKS